MTEVLRRVLVVGAGGFIGQHLVARLGGAGDCALTLMGNCIDGADLTEHTCFPGEVCGELFNQCAAPDVIFYLAGGASVGESIARPFRDFQRTVSPLYELLEKVKNDWQSSHIVYVSSAAVYGRSATCATNTASALSPVSPYGLHKKMAEELLCFYAAEHGVGVSIVRPFSVYGEGLKKQLLWDALQKSSRGDHRFFGSGRELRDWVYVGDLVSFVLSIGFNHKQYPRVINAGSGVAVSTREILTTLFSLFGETALPEFKEENKSGDPQHLVADFEEQRSYAGFFVTPLPVALLRYVSWYRSNAL